MAIQKITDYVITDNAVDGTKISMGSDAAGDVLYYDGTNYIRLGKGTAGQALVMNAGATAPEWGTSASSNGVITQHFLIYPGTGGLNATLYNNTWVKPTGVTCIFVQVVGGGQAGGSNVDPGDPGTGVAGVAGSPGGYAENYIDVRNITSLDYQIGIQATNANAGVWAGPAYFGSNGTIQSSAGTVAVNGSGVITSITGYTGGSGITIPPVIIIEANIDGGPAGRFGAGATAIANISGGAVTGVTVTNGGSGYAQGQVQAWFGMGGVTGVGYGATQNSNHIRGRLPHSFVAGYGSGGGGEPANGGAIGKGGSGGIFIREYR